LDTTSLLLSDNSRQALIAVTASLMGLQVSAVSIAREYLIDTNSTTGLSQVGVVFNFLVQNSDFPELTFATPATLFSAVSALLDNSISGGQFDTALISVATQYQAAELFESGFDPTVNVTPPTFITVDTTSDSETEKSDLSGGELAGVVIGVIVVFALIVLCMWYTLKECGAVSESAPPDVAVVTALEEKDKNILVNKTGEGGDMETWEVVSSQQITISELGCSQV
jgi:hypothetical protein